MNFPVSVCRSAALVTMVLVTGIGAAPPVLPSPETPAVPPTENIGELAVSWNPVSGARNNEAGWLNRTEAQPVARAGEGWLNFLHYDTLRENDDSYIVKGGDYPYGIIRPPDTAAKSGVPYAQPSAWSSTAEPANRRTNSVSPTTALPLPEGGSLDIRGQPTFGSYSIKANGFGTPSSVTLTTQDSTSTDLRTISSRGWSGAKARLHNGFGTSAALQREKGYEASADTQNALVRSSDHNPGPAESRRDTAWSSGAPEDASTLASEVRPVTVGTHDNGAEHSRISPPKAMPTASIRPVTLLASATSPHEVQLTWSLDIDDVGGLALLRDGRLVAHPSSTDETYTDTNLSPNVRYTYRLVLTTSGGREYYDLYSVATLAYPPMLSDQMATHRTGLQQPIVDERNPDYTEYRVVLSQVSGSHQSMSDWSTDKCRIFNDLRPTRYNVIAVARNLEGVITAPADVRAENVGHPDARPMRTVYPWYHHGTEDPWVKGRIQDAAMAFGLTDAAADWMSNRIFIERIPEVPGWAGYRGGRVGIGHSNLGTLMHEVMHGLWQYWDGFPEPCDRMNKYTFRRDVAQFALDFRDYENAGVDNPLEPWRAYYDLITQLMRAESLQEDYWDVLERGEYGTFDGTGGTLWHLMETSIPAYNPHHTSLIPPRFRKYFHGFMEDGENRTWDAEFDQYRRMADEDRNLWFPFLTGEIFHHSSYAGSVAPDAPRARIPEPLRTTLHDVNRQMLVDFINHLEEFSPPEWTGRFWKTFALRHLYHLSLFGGEMNPSVGIDLEQRNLDAVLEALWLLNTLICEPGASSCRLSNDWSSSVSGEQVHDAISSMENLTDAQRSALLGMVELRSIAPRSDNSEEDEAALLALYRSSDGTNWANNANWASSRPLGEWYGVETDQTGRVVAVRLHKNGLSGTIPTEIGNLTETTFLDLGNNELNGEIPPTVGNLTKLTELRLGRNRLTGEMPPELANLKGLVNLNLAMNRLTGPVPRWLANYGGLKYLELNRNRFTGQIPKELGSLSQLEDLRLLVNQLDGEIPAELGNLTNLRILLLSQNMLSGPIPAELGNLSNIEQLILSNNQLTGDIPPRLGDLPPLRRFDLAGNRLTGCIPAKLRGFGDHGLGLPFC